MKGLFAGYNTGCDFLLFDCKVYVLFSFETIDSSARATLVVNLITDSNIEIFPELCRTFKLEQIYKQILNAVFFISARSPRPRPYGPFQMQAATFLLKTTKSHRRLPRNLSYAEFRPLN